MSPYREMTATARLAVGPHSLLERNGIIFNDRSQLECFWVDDFTGFDRADIRLSEEDRPQEDGATPYPSHYGGRTMTLTGEVKAGSYPTLLEMTGALEDSCLDQVETPLFIRVAAGSPFFQAPDAQIYCRPSDWQVDRKLATADKSGVFRRNFTVALRATNPRYLSLERHSFTIEPKTVSALGRIYDRTYPLVYTHFMDPSGAPAASGAVEIAHNAGNWQALPFIRFTGYMSGIKLKNLDNGHQIKLIDAIAAGDWIDVDVARGSVRDSLGNPAGVRWDSTSDWMRIEGQRNGSTGDNTIILSAEEFAPGSSVYVEWSDTWMSA